MSNQIYYADLATGGEGVYRDETPEETAIREGMQKDGLRVLAEEQEVADRKAAALVVVAERAAIDPGFAALLELLK